MLIPALDKVVSTIRACSVSAQRLVVAIDGRSGSGKSTVALALARDIGAAIVPCDDFFAANVSNVEWDALTPEQRVAEAIDWRRLRREAIEPLRAGRPALWYAFDFQAGPRIDGTYPLQEAPTELAKSCQPIPQRCSHCLGRVRVNSMRAPNNAFERPMTPCALGRGQRVSHCAPSAHLGARRSAAQRER